MLCESFDLTADQGMQPCIHFDCGERKEIHYTPYILESAFNTVQQNKGISCMFQGISVTLCIIWP